MKKQINIQKITGTLRIPVILVILGIPVVSAQGIHEFSAYGGAGLSTLRYQLSSGNASNGFGGDFGAGYTYFRNRERVTATGKVFRERWGIHSGLGLGFYNANAKLNNVKTLQTGLSDGEDKPYNIFDLHTTLSRYNEKQKTIFLTIPVMGLFQIDQFYGLGGIKLGIPLSGKYTSSNATLTNKAYYPGLDNWAETQTFAGLGSFKGKDSHGSLDLSVFVTLSFELGMKWMISSILSVYTGIYFDYGLNNVVKKGSHVPFVNYSYKNAANFTTNSVLSSYTDNSKSTTFADKVNPMAVGIKVRVAYEKH